MTLTNGNIYIAANTLSNLNINNITMPVRIGFFLQKNISTVLNAAQEVEIARANLIQSMGEINESGTHYIVPPDKMAVAQQELNDLMALEQDLNIHIFKLDDFDGIELTYEQLTAIQFMIEE